MPWRHQVNVISCSNASNNLSLWPHLHKSPIEYLRCEQRYWQTLDTFQLGEQQVNLQGELKYMTIEKKPTKTNNYCKIILSIKQAASDCSLHNKMGNWTLL